MGTRFRIHFEDDVFSGVIREAAARLFGSCLSDLTVHAVARCRSEGPLTDVQASALAFRIYDSALTDGLHGFPDRGNRIQSEAVTRFQQRLLHMRWDEADDISLVFSSSEEDLVTFAPVVDEFKELDREIVMNSIRFRWRDVREQLRKRLKAASIADEWTNKSFQLAHTTENQQKRTRVSPGCRIRFGTGMT